MDELSEKISIAAKIYRYLFLLLVLAIVGCLNIGPDIALHPSMDEIRADSPRYNEVLQIQYLGAGGFFLRRGDQAILTAPMYSNPHWARVGLGLIKPDTSMINRLHPILTGVNVETILVGHAHYDHLLDVPYIARTFHPAASIYGSPTAANIALAVEPSLADKMVSLKEAVSRDGKPGHWFYASDSSYRFMAIASGHGPHWTLLHVMKGEIKDKLTSPPKTAWGWKEGETLAYLVDFLSTERNIDFRLYYQDATTPDSVGFPPHFTLHDDAPVDLAIFCVGSAQVQPGYPANFMKRYQPEHVILGHWEYIWKSAMEEATRMPVTDLSNFVAEVTKYSPDTNWILPKPRAIYHYQLD